jgi:hypothetical protein
MRHGTTQRDAGNLLLVGRPFRGIGRELVPQPVLQHLDQVAEADRRRHDRHGKLLAADPPECLAVSAGADPGIVGWARPPLPKARLALEAILSPSTERVRNLPFEGIRDVTRRVVGDQADYGVREIVGLRESVFFQENDGDAQESEEILDLPSGSAANPVRQAFEQPVIENEQGATVDGATRQPETKPGPDFIRPRGKELRSQGFFRSGSRVANLPLTSGCRLKKMS